MKLGFEKGIRKILSINQYLLSLYGKYVLGWGRKKSFFSAKAHAKKHGLKVLCLEDGFVRSLGLSPRSY